jgi:enamine deaminase RidA (YjgF/YER057c/UK114 family)
MSAESRLQELNLELPSPPQVLGLYKPVVIVGSWAYTSGHGPIGVDGSAVCGRLGDDLDVQAGFDAARRAALLVLASLRNHCGSLDRVRRLVKTVGLVQSTPTFTEHPAVINGFSEVMRDVFGADGGVAARSAFGAPSLPGGWAVEIEAIFEVEV